MSPDWRSDEAYAPLLNVDPALIAWEWLRRQPGYQKAWTDGGSSPAAWDLVAFENPETSVPLARPMWRAGAMPGVLVARGLRATHEADAFDLNHPLLVSRRGGSVLHCALCDGYQLIRLDITDEAVGPQLQLHYQLSGFASLDRPLTTLQRLRRFRRTGRVEPVVVSRHRRRRLVLTLRSHDALVAGASQQDIARQLLAAQGNGIWRFEQPHLRSRAQRLVRLARRMVAGGYRVLLQ